MPYLQSLRRRSSISVIARLRSNTLPLNTRCYVRNAEGGHEECDMCAGGDAETPAHFLCVCSAYDAARADMFVAIHSALSNLSTSVVSESAVRELQLWLKRAVCCDMFDALIGSDMPDHPHSPTLRVKEVRELLNRCVATFAVKAWNMRTERSTQSPSSAG